ncbi:hypothetical protein NDU88_004148 [Pleurodeles waltl]|uniref:Uncharacterized protein n=1 Tax=Pleurodeles waltl TaxID=8319 RepID=A0AAV7MSU3_PLEWA|nr:hypothetical protein NDU88_004148 [Pleurodeles waltl]
MPNNGREPRSRATSAQQKVAGAQRTRPELAPAPERRLGRAAREWLEEQGPKEQRPREGANGKRERPSRQREKHMMDLTSPLTQTIRERQEAVKAVASQGHRSATSPHQTESLSEQDLGPDETSCSSHNTAGGLLRITPGTSDEII